MKTDKKSKIRRKKKSLSVEERLVRQMPTALLAVVNALAKTTGRRQSRLREKYAEQAITEGAVLLVVRLLFVFYAEAHRLLPIDNGAYGADLELTQYAQRALNGEASDIQGRCRALFEAIHKGSDAGGMGLGAHGGRLFNLKGDPIMGEGLVFAVDDEDFKALLRHLLFVGRSKTPVFYAEYGAEQLGHLYEVLLPYRIHFDAANKAYALVGGTKRRSTGSHYTPRALTEPIVAHALGPLLPEGLPPRERAAKILELKICDMAMGAGAFLMAATRYLSAYLLKCWEEAEAEIPLLPVAMPLGVPATELDDAHILPGSGTLLRGPRVQEERRNWARRYVAERCMYGVDRNPLAVEMARISLWLLTFSKNLPFSSLEHNLKVGDSILGVDQPQLLTLSLEREGPAQPYLFDAPVAPLVADAVRLRAQLSSTPLRSQADIRARNRLRKKAHRAMDLLRVLGNILVASHFGSGGKKAYRTRRERARIQTLEIFEEWKRLGGPGPKYDEVKATWEARLGGRNPLHWPVAFPEIFLGDEASGFDAIIGNPPFGNAIEKTTSRDEDSRLFFQSSFAEAAQGAYDLCNLFIVAAVRHLKVGGRYALVQPRSNLSQRSAMATQNFVEENAPLEMLLAPDDAQLFAGTSVYIACVIGTRSEAGAGGAKPVRVYVDGDIRDAAAMAQFLPRAGEPWWTLVSQRDRPQLALRDDLIPLKDLATIHAGCATGAAYALKTVIDDDAEGLGPKLITTGLIDRYEILWGEREVRYLKEKYQYPRWPDEYAETPKAVFSAMQRQQGPKVLVGGLSRRVEAVADLRGHYAGVVSTWVIRPNHDALPVQVLAVLLNSWIFSFEYMRLFGAKRMGDGNWTFGRRELQDTLVPPEVLSPHFIRDILGLLDEQGRPRDGAAEMALQHRVAMAYGVGMGEMPRLQKWYFEG